MQKHKLLAFLLALVVSIGLWLYAVAVVNPNDTKEIEINVEFDGSEALLRKNLILTDGEGQKVTVNISGKRGDLKELNSKSLTAGADLSSISYAGKHEVTWQLKTSTSVALGDIKLNSPNDNKVTVEVSEIKTLTEIPIEVTYTGELPKNFLRGEPTLSVDTLSVTGLAEEMDKIDHAVVTVPLDGKTVTVDEDFTYSFVDAEGNVLTLSDYTDVPAPTIHVFVEILRYKEITLQAKLIAGGGATAIDAVCKFEPSSILVTGSEELLAQMPDTLNVIEIDLATLTEDTTTLTVTPTLPAGVSNRAEDPKVKVTVTLKGLKTKEFTIDCAEISILNNETGLKIAQQTVTVKVRGKADAVNALTLESLTEMISVDMSKYDPATRKVDLILNQQNGVSFIGGPYAVTVSEST